LASTAGAGADFEVVPFLNGEEQLPDNVIFNATGYYGQTFSYNTTPNPWGQSTLPLTGYDKYSISLYVDFAWTALTLIGATIPTPAGDYNQNYVVDTADYVVWRTNDWPPNDYETWRSHFGQFPGSNPEPATFIMLLIGLLIACTSRQLPRG
jgi:hypothetical protein